MHTVDVAVIGSGFGGLGAALRLAEIGHDTALFEFLNYPGGCASTHMRRGVPMASGATLLAGLSPGQLFHDWLGRHGVTLRTEPLDPVLVQVTGAHRVLLPPSRAAWAEELAALPGVDRGAVDRFLELQRRVATPLWELFAHPERLPPLGPRAVLGHARDAGRYLPVASVVGRTLGAVLDRCGLTDPTARALIDGLCQITVQLPADQADAPFALGALQVFFGGAAHLPDGVGALAEGMVAAVRHAGGAVHYAHRVDALARRDGGWELTTRRGTWRARAVVANLLPEALMQLIGERPARLQAVQERVQTGWGAAVWYAVLDDDPGWSAAGFHRQLVGAAPVGGHSAWVSVSGRGERDVPEGARTLVASTHLSADAPVPEVEEVQRRLQETVEQLAPDLATRVRDAWTASPRTFERFTRRPGGYVGGIPRRPELRSYLGLWPRPVAPGLWMVGDSVLYGQSTLATAVSGHRTGEAVRRFLA